MCGEHTTNRPNIRESRITRLVVALPFADDVPANTIQTVLMFAVLSIVVNCDLRTLRRPFVSPHLRMTPNAMGQIPILRYVIFPLLLILKIWKLYQLRVMVMNYSSRGSEFWIRLSMFRKCEVRKVSGTFIDDKSINRTF